MPWTFVENPAYHGQTPRPLEPACHDGSPFVTIRCDCGTDSHLHETQLDPLPAEASIGVRCAGCRVPLIFTAAELRDAFARMRASGWIGA